MVVNLRGKGGVEREKQRCLNTENCKIYYQMENPLTVLALPSRRRIIGVNHIG